MLTVEADADRVEERLRSGGMFCPFCAGVLSGWGFARPAARSGCRSGRIKVPFCVTRTFGLVRTRASGDPKP
jgi:hypothetical protein